MYWKKCVFKTLVKAVKNMSKSLSKYLTFGEKQPNITANLHKNGGDQHESSLHMVLIQTWAFTEVWYILIFFLFFNIG